MDQDAISKLARINFLDGLELGTDQDTVVIASYPRSGNTMLRAYLEKVTGLVSGSDCDITKKLNQCLMNMGLAGEGLVDKRVWTIKTHYPERYGKTRFGAERCVLLVRSPLDCFTSLFNMVCSGSHDMSIADNDFEKFHTHWGEFIQQEITVWKDFHDFWLKAKIPVHIIRYEDLVLQPASTLTDLIKFILNVRTLEGTRVEKYVALACQESAPEIYKPRKGKVNGNMAKFKALHLDFMYNYAKDVIDKFAYAEFFQTMKTEADSAGVVKTVPACPDLLTEPMRNNESVRIHNAAALESSIYNLFESDEITSIMVNYPALLLRKKSALYPEGRTSYRFKHDLRKLVTVNGMTMFETSGKKKKGKRRVLNLAPSEMD